MKPGLLRFLLGHLIVGLIAGWSALAALLFLDVGGLGTLLWESPDRLLLLVVMAIFFAITFGSLAMGTGIMSLRAKQDDEGKPPGGRLAFAFLHRRRAR